MARLSIYSGFRFPQPSHRSITGIFQVLRRSQRCSRSGQYPASVVATWYIACELLRERSYYALDLLHPFAFLSPTIMTDFLCSGSRGFTPNMHGISDRHTLTRSVLELESFSLVKWDQMRRTVYIHSHTTERYHRKHVGCRKEIDTQVDDRPLL
jgi:hypothetical protein